MIGDLLAALEQTWVTEEERGRRMPWGAASGAGIVRRRRELIVVWMLLASSMLGLVASSAHGATAGTAYGPDVSFGGGSISFTTQREGLAVQQSTGNIFVAQNGLGTFAIYAPDPVSGGTSITNATGGPSPSHIAVDPVDASIYSFDVFGPLTKYVSDGAPVPTYTADPFFSAPPGILMDSLGGLAVDPATRDLVAGDMASGRVYRLSSSGALLSSFNGADTVRGPLFSPTAIAIGLNRDIYVMDQQSRRVERFSAAGTSLGALPLDTPDQLLGLAVNPVSGDVTVEMTTRGVTTLNGFTATGQAKWVSTVQAAQSGPTIGLAASGSPDAVYAGLSDGTVWRYVPSVQPGADAPTASGIVPDGGLLSAAVAHGGEDTTARIEYCPADADCANSLTAQTPDPSSPRSNPGSPWIALADHVVLGSSPDPQVTITDTVSGLKPNKTYLLRVVATNARTDVTSATSTFTTALVAPAVTTGSASSVTTTSAEVAGTIDTIGAQTTYHFDYGLTDSYGSRVPANVEGTAGADRGARTFRRTLTGLTPGVTYHYRLVARNAAGETAGVDRTFTTPAGTPIGRAYEQVTPVDKKGGALNGVVGYQASAAGSAIVVAGSSTSTEGNGAPQIPRYLVTRGDTNWLNWKPLDPPLQPSPRLVSQTTLAISEDFQHALVVSNKVLAPGGFDHGGNLYVYNFNTGSYTFVAGASGPGPYARLSGANTSDAFVAGAPDFSWVVLTTPVPLKPGVSQAAMYKWSRSGGLTLESVLPDGTTPTGAVWLQSSTVLSTREVSSDGDDMYFSLTTGEGGVYQRSNGQTTAISESQVVPGTTQPGRLDGVSADGRYAVFHSGILTSDATGPGTDNLYRYDSLAALGSRLQFLGVIGHRSGSTDGTEDVLSVSPDAETVYYHDDALRTVVWKSGQTHVVSAEPVVLGYPSPNGRYLVYREAGNNNNAYVYDAEANAASCVSCSPDGGPDGGAGLGEDSRAMSNRVPQVVTDDGQVFFDSPAQLVGADRNTARDVYGWRNGVISLISSGDSNSDARYVDMSADAKDVYFVTGQSLVRQDDGGLDVYDARLGGGLPLQNPAPAGVDCVKTDCVEPGLGPVASPLVASPQLPVGATAKPRNNQERVRVSVSKVTIGSKSIRVTYRATQKGRLRISGSRVITTYRNVARSGTYSVSVPLSKKARSMRRAHEKFKLAIRLSLAGGWGTSVDKYSRTIGK